MVVVRTVSAETPVEPLYPRWMNKHKLAAYIVLSIDFFYFLGYIVFVGVIMNDWKIYLPFKAATQWLEINTYSLLPPVCAAAVSPLMIWQIKSNTELSEGDFYGILGTMLGLGTIALFDVSRIVQIYYSYEDCKNNGTSGAFKNAMQNGVAGNTYTDWQYRLKINISGRVTELFYEHTRDGRMHNTSMSAKEEQIFLLKANNQILPLGGDWITPYVADKGVRWWTHLIQRDFKCCGSKTYKEWDKFDGNIYPDGKMDKYIRKYGKYPPSCYCNFECPPQEIRREKCFSKCGPISAHMESMKSRKGCCSPFHDYVYRLYLTSIILTSIMAVLYAITIFTYCVNYAVIKTMSSVHKQKYEIEELVKMLGGEDREEYIPGVRSSKRLAEKRGSKKRRRQKGQVQKKQSRVSSKGTAKGSQLMKGSIPSNADSGAKKQQKKKSDPEIVKKKWL